MSKHETCESCGQRIPLTRKEMLNKHKVAMLKRAALHVKERFDAGAEDANDFMVRDFTEPEDFKRYNFFSHLRLHGLVFKQTDAAGNFYMPQREYPISDTPLKTLLKLTLKLHEEKLL